MFTKNVPTVERTLRAVAGIALIVGGLLFLRGSLWGTVLVASGVVAVMTGFAGFCPMCALAGRRIAHNIKKRGEENG